MATGNARAIGYVRVSTEEQAENGISLDAQIAKIRSYVELYGITLVDVAVDAGQSAGSLDRPGVQRLLRDLRTKRADGVIVTKLDRLTRSLTDLNVLLKDYFCEGCGLQLWSISDHIDTRTPSGRMMLNVLVSVLQWEREMASERTRAALEAFRREKMVPRRLRKLYGDDVPAEVVAATAGKLGAELPRCRNLDDGARARGRAIAARARREAADRKLGDIAVKVADYRSLDPGISQSRIADKLNEEGYKSPGGSRWTQGQVSRVLSRLTK
jgi:DNA invertase Pin-like site-specific DNA recombinase